MKVSVILAPISRTAFAAVVWVNLLVGPKVPAQAIIPAALASPPPAQMTTSATAEVERVIVTGSNILISPTGGFARLLRRSDCLGLLIHRLVLLAIRFTTGLYCLLPL
jgi:hypothetical protein